jgi:hypothetical protein
VSVFLFCVGPALPVPQLLEHETKAKCDKAKAAPASTSGTLGPSTTGHGPGMPIDVDGPADATTAALAAALDAALAAAATQHSGNSGADSKRKRRELGPAVELPSVPPAASPGAAPTAPPNAPLRKKKRFRGARPRGAADLHWRPDGAVHGPGARAR